MLRCLWIGRRELLIFPTLKIIDVKNHCVFKSVATGKCYASSPLPITENIFEFSAATQMPTQNSIPEPTLVSCFNLIYIELVKACSIYRKTLYSIEMNIK